MGLPSPIDFQKVDTNVAGKPTFEAVHMHFGSLGCQQQWRRHPIIVTFLVLLLSLVLVETQIRTTNQPTGEENKMWQSVYNTVEV